MVVQGGGEEMKLFGTLRYWFNAHFGVRRYSEVDGKCYVQEGNNPPEELFEHLRRHHPKEYGELKQRGGSCESQRNFL